MPRYSQKEMQMTLTATKTVGEIAAEMPSALANSKNLESTTAAAETAL